MVTRRSKNKARSAKTHKLPYQDPYREVATSNPSSSTTPPTSPKVTYKKGPYTPPAQPNPGSMIASVPFKGPNTRRGG